jgi:phage shock protein PspC (stress-responsive transcriptional regulator)
MVFPPRRRDDRSVDAIVASAANESRNVMSAPRRLYRDTTDKKIAGVCSGLARHIGVDPLLVRIGFVAALLIGGAPIVAYVLMWWLVDPAPAGEWEAATTTGDPSSPAAWAPPSDGHETNDVVTDDSSDEASDDVSAA